MPTLAEKAKANIDKHEAKLKSKQAEFDRQFKADTAAAIVKFKKHITTEVERLSALGYGGFKSKGDMIQDLPYNIREKMKKWLTDNGIKLELIDKSFQDYDSYGPLGWVERKWTRLTWGTRGTVLNDNIDKPRDWDD